MSINCHLTIVFYSNKYCYFEISLLVMYMLYIIFQVKQESDDEGDKCTICLSEFEDSEDVR